MALTVIENFSIGSVLDMTISVLLDVFFAQAVNSFPVGALEPFESGQDMAANVLPVRTRELEPFESGQDIAANVLLARTLDLEPFESGQDMAANVLPVRTVELEPFESGQDIAANVLLARTLDLEPFESGQDIAANVLLTRTHDLEPFESGQDRDADMAPARAIKRIPRRQVTYKVENDVMERLDRICKGKPLEFRSHLIDTMLQIFVTRLDTNEGQRLVDQIEQGTR